MPTYLRVPIETDPDTLLQNVYAALQARFPGWQPNDSALDVWLAQAVVAEAADNRDIAADVPDTIFRTLGASLLAIPPTDAVAASAQTTWTMIDSLGHIIPAGTYVGIRNSVGETIPFQTVADVIVPAGSTVTATGGVVIAAVNPGAASSGIGSVGAPVDLIDVLDYVASVTMAAASSGGLDAETDDAYMARLVSRLRRLSQRPILPNDFAEMAKDADRVIYRVVAIDGYNPATSTYNNDRMVTVSAVDANGDGVSSTVKTEIDTLLQANREINFIVNVMDPNYSTINVTTTVVAIPGYDHAALQTAVVTQINSYLSKARWGLDPAVTSAGINDTWVDKTTLRYNDLIASVGRVEGVAYVSDLTVAKDPAALARVDVALTAPASLTVPGAISVTVT